MACKAVVIKPIEVNPPHARGRACRYEGEWANDTMHGHGTFHGADGHRYVGSFQDGALHGKGVYEHKDGRRFEGEVFFLP